MCGRALVVEPFVLCVLCDRALVCRANCVLCVVELWFVEPFVLCVVELWL